MPKKELAVNSKKVGEVEAWLRKNKNSPGFLLLTGISGCGKTATLRVLCQELDYGIKEWTNTNSSYAKRFDEFMDDENDAEKVFDESQTRQFSKFMLRADYGSLDVFGDSAPSSSTDRHLVVLVKYFPNAFYRDPSALHDILRQYKKYGKRPVVFLISESPASSDLSARRMFPVRISEELKLDIITLNPLAPRFMIKALRQILTDAGVTENKDLLTEIAELSGGDMRIALNSLQVEFSGRRKRKSQKDKKKGQEIVSGRDQTMLLFSALGKFLYSKRVEEFRLGNSLELPGHLSALYRPLELSFDPEYVISRSSLTPDHFTLFLHENYLSLFPESSLDGAASAANDISVADSRGGDWSTKVFGGSDVKEYVGSIAGRSISFNNSDDHPLKHQRNLMRRPKWKDVSFEVFRKVPEMTEAFVDWRMSTTELTCEVIPYLKGLHTN